MSTFDASVVANWKTQWRAAVTPYQHADFWRSLWQILNTFVPYLLLWYLMYRALAISYWLTLPLAVLAAGFLVRLFIIFHDCGHGSFFTSRLANDILGVLIGVLTFTPYFAWRHSHAIHHATAGDLDRRGNGDVWTMTLAEYRAAPRWHRIAYRVFRFPPVTFLIGPAIIFLVVQRIPLGTKDRRDLVSIHGTNFAILGVAAVMAWLIGLKAYLLIQLPITALAATYGVWLFYVQHQFEGTYWSRHEDWDFVVSAMQGASFYKLPKVLQWFSGNIGFHNIHHLSPRIPNYFLERCHRDNPIFQQIRPVTFGAGLRSLRLRLWDEATQRLVGFG